MDHVDASVECGRLAEKDELRSRLQLLVHPLDTLEENHLHLPGTVSHPNTHSTYGVELQCVGFSLSIGTVEIDPGDPCTDLKVCHIRSRVTDPDNGTLVDVPERVQTQKIADSLHCQLLPQKFSPLRPHPRQKLNLHIQSMCHITANLIN